MAPAPKNVVPLYQRGLPLLADKFNSVAPLQIVPLTTGAAGFSTVLLTESKSFALFWSPVNCGFNKKV